MVGGTAAGWTAAVRLASTFGGAVSVTVLETPSRGAGDCETGQVSAVPERLQRDLFDRLGVLEEEWMRECCASFQTAVRHVNWRTAGSATTVPRIADGGGIDHFYRPCAEIPECEEFPLSEYWGYRRNNGETVEPFDYACFREPPLMDAGKSPRWMDGRAALPYGWHVDIRMFTNFLRNLGMRRFGVRSIRDELLHAEQDERGMLNVLHTGKGVVLGGDLFLDCTGSERLLLAGTLGEPFIDVQDRLPCDSTATLTVAQEDARHGIDPFTTVTALPMGWAWKMPLPGRAGAGLVYGRHWTEPDEAARVLCGLWGLRPESTAVRHSRHRAGRSRRAWVKNCVALGACAYFLEPLADEGLGEILQMVDRLVRDFPSPGDREAPAARFNRAVEVRYRRARDLARLRYAASPREDTPFWKAQRDLPLSAALRDCLTGYRLGLAPDRTTHELPYYALLSSLTPSAAAVPRPALAHRAAARRSADARFLQIKRQQQILLETLPTAGEYLHRLHSRPVGALPTPASVHAGPV
ncbi:tryptophan 7-halogenase [Streptomyces sp. NPDC048442]|uniref:tryptophan 7-halogenase n=1 Tax=Streptomyces sp. NPDC048442 TaxID=3154823 RepID=UPI0034269595